MKIVSKRGQQPLQPEVEEEQPMEEQPALTIADAQSFLDLDVIEDWEYIPTEQCYKVKALGKTHFLTVEFINQVSIETIREILVK